MLVYFEQVLPQVGQQLGGEAGIGDGLLVGFFQLIQQLQAHFGKIIHEVEGVLHLVGHTRGKGGQGHHLLALHQLGLGGFQLGQGLVEAVALAGNFLVFLVQSAVGALLQKNIAGQQGQQQQQAPEAHQQRVHFLALPVGTLGLQLAGLGEQRNLVLLAGQLVAVAQGAAALLREHARHGVFVSRPPLLVAVGLRKVTLPGIGLGQ